MNGRQNIGAVLDPPLACYKDRWETLREIPAIGGQSFGEGSTWKRRRVKILARGYFASYPGHDEWAANLSLHHRLKKILGGTDDFVANEIDRLYNCITYRLGAMHEAEEVRRNMGIQFPSIFEFDVDKWKLDESALTPDRNELYSRVLGLLQREKVLTQPVGGGLYYTKLWYCLGIALVESGMDWSEIQCKVAMAASERAAWYQSIYRGWRGRRVVEDKDVLSHTKAFINAMKELGRKVKERGVEVLAKAGQI